MHGRVEVEQNWCSNKEPENRQRQKKRAKDGHLRRLLLVGGSGAFKTHPIQRDQFRQRVVQRI